MLLGSSLDTGSYSVCFGFLSTFLGDSVVKNLPVNARDSPSIPGLGRSPGEGHGYSLQYSYLENPTGRAAWRSTVHEVAESWARLSD